VKIKQTIKRRKKVTKENEKKNLPSKTQIKKKGNQR
jgi:hypothetical protein